MLKGLCTYCSRPTSTSCELCGRLICPDHTARDGLCINCARKPTFGPGDVDVHR